MPKTKEVDPKTPSNQRAKCPQCNNVEGGIMVLCSGCKQWFHNVVCAAPSSPLDEDEVWNCIKCDRLANQLVLNRTPPSTGKVRELSKASVEKIATLCASNLEKTFKALLEEQQKKTDASLKELQAASAQQTSAINATKTAVEATSTAVTRSQEALEKAIGDAGDKQSAAVTTAIADASDKQSAAVTTAIADASDKQATAIKESAAATTESNAANTRDVTKAITESGASSTKSFLEGLQTIFGSRTEPAQTDGQHPAAVTVAGPVPQIQHSNGTDAGPVGASSEEQTNLVNGQVRPNEPGSRDEEPFDIQARLDEMNSRVSQMETRSHQSQQPLLQQRSLTPSTIEGTDVTAASSHIAVSMRRKTIKPLEKFDGDELKFPIFKATFERTSTEGQFSEQENVDRLRAALTGQAAAIALPSLDQGNATGAMQQLRDVFGRREDLIVKSVQVLDNLPQLTSETDRRIVNFSGAVSNFVTTMKLANCEDQLASGYLLHRLEQKMHFSQQKEWRRFWAIAEFSGSSKAIEFLAQFLSDWVKTTPLNCLRDPEPNRKRNPEDKRQGGSDNKKPRVNAHQTPSTSTSSQPKKSKCFACQGDHSIYKCEKFAKMNIKDRWILVKEKRPCFGCLKFEHDMRDCTTTRKCGLNGCTRTHNRLLHSDPKRHDSKREEPRNAEQSDSVLKALRRLEEKWEAQQSSSNPKEQPNQKSATNNGVTMLTHAGETSALYKIVLIRIYGPNGYIDDYAFLDEGAGVTLMHKDIFDKLGFEGEEDEITMQWSNEITRTEKAMCTTITIAGCGPKRKLFELENVFAVDNLDLPEQSVDAEEMKQQYHHLRDLPLISLEKAKPRILIGLSHINRTANIKTVFGGDNEPIAGLTPLGWALYGAVPSPLKLTVIACHRSLVCRKPELPKPKVEADNVLHDLVKGFFSTDNFGIIPAKKKLIGAEEERAVAIMERTLKQVGGRYEIGLLWKSDNIKLPDNYQYALSRLQSEEKKLLKNPEILEWKNNHVRELVKKGYARIATEEELSKTWDRVWYCPTFIVMNMNKIPPKPRDVSDVAAQVKGVSLNNQLLKGPDNLIPLQAGLFKFREHAIAVTADVKEMFHQIKIIEEDQQCQRFLWRDADTSKEPTTYIMERMMFGPTCSPTCAQFVKNHHAMKFVDECPEAVKGLTEFTYVDDYFNSHPTFEDAARVTNDAFKICDSMGFSLVGVQSNSEALTAQLPKEKLKTSVLTIDLHDAEVSISKVLGVAWLDRPDVFTFKLGESDEIKNILQPNKIPTKRELLSVIMKIFDPLGLIAHFLIRGKMILQEVWREGTGWDDPIPPSSHNSWLDFIRDLQQINNLKIPRRYCSMNPEGCHVSLVVFVDASEMAFAATAYFIFKHEAGTEVAQVMGKAKVAPIKKLTIPQLELQAAVMGVRLATTIKKSHSIEIHQVIFLSDSKVTIAWISSSKFKFKMFVAARVGEILESTNPDQWYHVGSKNNVADDATKPNDVNMGDAETRWFLGPKFLTTPFEEWPVTAAVQVKEDETPSFAMMIHRPTPQVSGSNFIDDLSPRFKIRWKSFVATTAWVLRALNIMRGAPRPADYLTPEELRRAEDFIFKKIQAESFSDDIALLLDDTPGEISTYQGRLLKFAPFMDDGLIRMSSRAQKATTSYAAKNPIILPSGHPYVELYIKYLHEKNFHSSLEKTIADVRERVWVIDVRKAVRHVTRNCQACKNRRAEIIYPRMASLHASRVAFEEKPFTHTGLDAFGPYNITQGRSTVKRYGLIFTCLTFRIVHLEVLEDMSTGACIAAIENFVSRRGQVAHFHSDNGTNFVGARNFLHSEMAKLKKELEEEVTLKFGIEWHFIPAYSPWMGGAWERLIRSIKKCLEFTMNQERPHDSVFRNAIIKAEWWMNQRPLTHLSIDHEDDPPLTPNSILFGEKFVGTLPSVERFEQRSQFSTYPSKRAQHLVEKYLSRWVKEYLPEHHCRSKWQKEVKPLQVGDVVILTEPNEPKSAWKKGRITQVYPGEDGQVRSADVEIVEGGKKFVRKNRAAGRLAVLDITPSN